MLLHTEIVSPSILPQAEGLPTATAIAQGVLHTVGVYRRAIHNETVNAPIIEGVNDARRLVAETEDAAAARYDRALFAAMIADYARQAPPLTPRIRYLMQRWHAEPGVDTLRSRLGASVPLSEPGELEAADQHIAVLSLLADMPAERVFTANERLIVWHALRYRFEARRDEFETRDINRVTTALGFSAFDPSCKK